MAKVRVSWTRLASIERKYRITASTIVLDDEDGRRVARTVKGTIVMRVGGIRSERAELLTIMWDGKEAMLFTQDLQSRGELLSE
jgi:hypothetical protein